MEKRNKAIYWVFTGLLCLMVLMSAGMYVFKYDDISPVFTRLGFPVFIIYPLAVAKVLAVIAILSKQSKFLKEWAYAGLFYDFILALAAHLVANDGEFAGAAIALVLLFGSYFFDKKLFA